MAEKIQAHSNNNDSTLRIELFIARLLRWGVIVSFVIVAIGIGMVLITGQTGYHEIRLDDLNSIVGYNVKPDFPSTLGEVWNGLLALKPYAIIALGLLLLIAIPVMRVTVSVIAFAMERDWLYVALTAIVLLVLLTSFLIGEAGG
ncbi:MAG: DUF1634 domain-containing protein [Chloroflexi bacterium]|nr:DUF1634 domain-containing protein [Chloroflexota bacterium]